MTLLSEEIAADVATLAEAPAGGGVQFLSRALPRAGVADTAAAIARRLGNLGFVTVRAGIDPPGAHLADLAHRHLVLLRLDRKGESAAEWIRRLASVSTRRHVLVDLSRAGRASVSMPPLARERRRHDSHSDEIAARAHTLIARGEIERAEALVASAMTEAALRGEAPVALRLRTAELRFWQGRFEEAGAALDELPESAEAAALRGLVAWAVGRKTGLLRARDLLASVSEPVPWPSRARLRRAIAAESFAAGGDRTKALAALGAPREWAGAESRDLLLFEWMRARLEGQELGDVLRRVKRSGLGGIRRWGLGSQSMHLVHAIPAVLERVQDAEDDLAALATACRWARDECQAEAAAILTVDGILISSIGWSSSHTAALVRERDDGRAITATAPVRSSGVRIGTMAVRGPGERAETLREAASLAAALVGPALRARIDAMRAARDSRSATPEIVGRSPAIVALKETIVRAAATPFAVLIEGESGTGKELVARAIHRLSPRRDRRFSALNCAAISDELVEAELFGHARGAFTGAVGARTGLFEDAHAGSLFLDEVSELSPRAQAKLLRVIQEREVRRVGENNARAIDVRVIAATNQPLAEAVRRGTFREDLLFRLAVVRLRLPPLRDRCEDIPLLIDGCWRQLCDEARKRAALGPDALASLCRHTWPGNVREFQNVMAALVVLAPERGRVGARHVRQVIEAGAPEGEDEPVPLGHLRERVERRAVTDALARHDGRRAAAARDLGLTRQGLAKAIKRLGLARGDGETTGVAPRPALRRSSGA